MESRAHIIISGLVQGVLFRKSIGELAHALGVTGWVRNLHDGRVEALVEGEKVGLDELIRFCRVGPPGANVRNVDVQWSEYKAEFHGFRITH